MLRGVSLGIFLLKQSTQTQICSFCFFFPFQYKSLSHRNLHLSLCAGQIPVFTSISIARKQVAYEIIEPLCFSLRCSLFLNFVEMYFFATEQALSCIISYLQIRLKIMSTLGLLMVYSPIRGYLSCISSMTKNYHLNTKHNVIIC